MSSWALLRLCQQVLRVGADLLARSRRWFNPHGAAVVFGIEMKGQGYAQVESWLEPWAQGIKLLLLVAVAAGAVFVVVKVVRQLCRDR